MVARPSDNDYVKLYYTSEFDVLEYTDAEFWCEDGKNSPKQITFGHLLKSTKINRIPIKNLIITDADLKTLQQTPRSNEFEFNPIPFAPQRVAQVIASFANTDGGRLIFGIKERDVTSNNIVGLSNDFRMVEIVKNAISLLSPIPIVTYNWMMVEEKTIFVIDTKKSDEDILIDDAKFIRIDSYTQLVKNSASAKNILASPTYKNTIAIIVCIENYKPRKANTLNKVAYANNDAAIFKQFLMENMFIDESNIYVFSNENALKSDLENELKYIYYNLSEEDRLLFYYVGHGFHDGINNFISTYDTHMDDLKGSSASLQNILLDPLKQSKCKNVLIFIDACAQIFREDNGRHLVSDINEEEFHLLRNEFPHYATFLSCQTGQSSYSSDILENGIWTYHLIEALKGNIEEVFRDGKYITDRLLSDYLSISVPEYTNKEHRKEQNPRAILDSSYENIILEINK